MIDIAQSRVQYNIKCIAYKQKSVVNVGNTLEPLNNQGQVFYAKIISPNATNLETIGGAFQFSVDTTIIQTTDSLVIENNDFIYMYGKYYIIENVNTRYLNTNTFFSSKLSSLLTIYLRGY